MNNKLAIRLTDSYLIEVLKTLTHQGLLVESGSVSYTFIKKVDHFVALTSGKQGKLSFYYESLLMDESYFDLRFQQYVKHYHPRTNWTFFIVGKKVYTYDHLSMKQLGEGRRLPMPPGKVSSHFRDEMVEAERCNVRGPLSLFGKADPIRLLEVCDSGEVLVYDLQRKAMLLITRDRGTQLDVLWPVRVNDDPCDEPYLLFDAEERAKMQAVYDAKAELIAHGLGWKLEYPPVVGLGPSHEGEVPFDDLVDSERNAK